MPTPDRLDPAALFNVFWWCGIVFPTTRAPA
jgi:hypothetical protein